MTRFLVGLVGADVGGSLSPALHEQEADELGIRLLYRTVEAGDLPLADLLHAARAFGFAGINVTHPCKQTVLPLLDDLAPEAAELGAVNTVVFRDGAAIGHNTDGAGFADSLRLDLPDVPLGRVLLLGAGGAGAAVGHALLGAGVDRLTVADVDGVRAARLAARLAARFGAGRAVAGPLPAAPPDVDGIVNASPIGMSHAPGTPVPVSEVLTPDMWVADVIYRPWRTELLAYA